MRTPVLAALTKSDALTELSAIATKGFLRSDALDKLISHARLPLCITDPTLPDNPIVYVNTAFLTLTGFTHDEVINRNCRFLQGPDTTDASLNELRRAIRNQDVAIVEIVNYRKDGTSFVNALQIGPVQDEDGKTILYFGSQLDISKSKVEQRRAVELETMELLHRLRNIVNVLSVVIRMTAREVKDVDTLVTLVIERLNVLSEAHFKTFATNTRNTLSLQELAETILLAYAPHGAAQCVIEGPEFRLPQELISPMTLVLHELATNAVKHGALGADDGKVAMTWQMQEGEGSRILTVVWQERAGPKVVNPERSSGSQIIKSLVSAAGGELIYDWQSSGLVATITFAL